MSDVAHYKRIMLIFRGKEGEKFSQTEKLVPTCIWRGENTTLKNICLQNSCRNYHELMLPWK